MTLREPRGIFQETIRRLAVAAMSVTHHDIGDSEPEYVSEMQALERLFTNILRGKLKPKGERHSPSARSAPSFDPLLGSGGLPLEQGNEQ